MCHLGHLLCPFLCSPGSLCVFLALDCSSGAPGISEGEWLCRKATALKAHYTSWTTCYLGLQPFCPHFSVCKTWSSPAHIIWAWILFVTGESKTWKEWMISLRPQYAKGGNWNQIVKTISVATLDFENIKFFLCFWGEKLDPFDQAPEAYDCRIRPT